MTRSIISGLTRFSVDITSAIHINIYLAGDHSSDIVTMQEEEEARRAILNIQEEIRRDLAKEKELQEARNILRRTVNK